MEDRLKWLALVGAGALIGSVSTIALLKFLNRGVEDQGCSSKSTESNAERECFTNGILRMNGEDLLKDEIVSEQLTSDTSVNNKGMMNGKYDNRAGVVESLKFPMAKEYLSPSKIRTKGEQFLFGGGSSYHHGLIRNQKEDYLVGGGGMHRTDRVEKFVCLGGGSCCWKNKYQEGPKEFRVCSRARYTAAL